LLSLIHVILQVLLPRCLFSFSFNGYSLPEFSSPKPA
jgi:hypothetical protein